MVIGIIGKTCSGKPAPASGKCAGRILCLLAALALLLGLAACGAAPAPAETPAPAEAPSAPPVPETPAPTEAPGTTALLLVCAAGERDAAQAIADGAADAVPGLDVRIAETAELRAAMERAAADGVGTLAVQPTLTVNGPEYTALYGALAEAADAFGTVVLGTPLLTADEDYRAVAGVLAEAARAADGAACCWMLRGAGEDADFFCGMLTQELRAAGCESCFVGAADALPGAQETLEAVLAGGFDRAVLRPLLLAGDAQSAEDAERWRADFEAAGVAAACERGGLCELDAVRALFVAHALDALDWAASAQ